MVNRSMNSHFQSLSLLGLVFCNSIHREVASDSFCFLINSFWLLVFIIYVFFMIFSGFLERIGTVFLDVLTGEPNWRRFHGKESSPLEASCQ